ncbi:hypothetical protein F5Y12DRAFT_759848 [Xylaria sp. FL1777]|nr:hypothetical protein F5Y12DRAFT_759848 [Xylaria sp. FL1777]
MVGDAIKPSPRSPKRYIANERGPSMTELQDPSHRGEPTPQMPCSGRDPQAGVSTAPADSGSQPPGANQSRRCLAGGVPGATAARLLGQDVDVSPAEDDDISPSPSALTSAFLNLPLEIRLEIYSHLLTAPPSPPHPPLIPPSPSPSSSSSPSSSPSPAPFFAQQTAPSPLHPSILRTCRQLHAEGTPVLYRSNTFLAHASLLTVFPSLFRPGHPRRSYAPVRSAPLAALVTRFRVRLRLDAEPQFARDAATAQFSGKSELVIEAWQTEWRAAGPDALRLFEGVRGVGAARVTGSTSGFEDYARWLERAMMAAVGDCVTPFAWEDGLVKGSARA